MIDAVEINDRSLHFMNIKLPKIIATSVVRGSQKGESHGGVFTVDFASQRAEQHVDWDTGDIDFSGRGADRGLRGICFDADDIYIAASDELFCYDRDFKVRKSWRNRYLKHCHEIYRKDRKIFLTSTGHDCVLVFDIEEEKFTWGFHVLRQQAGWSGFVFDPIGKFGPRPINEQHINMIHVDARGIYLSGLRTQALLYINSRNEVNAVCSLPAGTHNARPYNGGVIFNDTESDCLRVVRQSGEQQAFKIRHYDPDEIRYQGVDDSKIARQGFGRGLCVVDDRFVAGGSSPSTITLYDIQTGQVASSVNMTMDIRNAIHGLELWPYD